MLNSEQKGTLLVVLSAILFGLMPYFAVNAYKHGIDVTNLLVYRYFFAFILMMIFCLIRKINIKINFKQFTILLVSSIIGTVLTTYTLFLSYTLISTGLASSLHFTYPIFTIILARIVYKSVISKKKYIALALSCSGIVLLSSFTDKTINIQGVVWALLSGILYAIYIISIANKELRKLSPFCISLWIFGISAISFIALATYNNNLITDIKLESLFYILNLSFWSTFLAVALFYIGMTKIGPSDASLLSTLEPLTGIFIGLIYFNEILDTKTSIAICLILVSVLILSVNTKRKLNYKFFRK